MTQTPDLTPLLKMPQCSHSFRIKSMVLNEIWKVSFATERYKTKSDIKNGKIHHQQSQRANDRLGKNVFSNHVAICNEFPQRKR